MTTDPNWLYSTIAQSSAAIVAIMGDFITAIITERGIITEPYGERIKRIV